MAFSEGWRLFCNINSEVKDQHVFTMSLIIEGTTEKI
jgi:hypothetical protein